MFPWPTCFRGSASMGRRRNRSSSDSRRSRRRDRSRRTSRSRSPSGRRDRFPETQPRTPSVGISSMRATQPGFHWCQVPTAAFGVASGPQAQASLSAQKGAEAASSWKYSSRWQEQSTPWKSQQSSWGKGWGQSKNYGSSSSWQGSGGNRREKWDKPKGWNLGWRQLATSCGM